MLWQLWFVPTRAREHRFATGWRELAAGTGGIESTQSISGKSKAGIRFWRLFLRGFCDNPINYR
jgi:hypothetical protein